MLLIFIILCLMSELLSFGKLQRILRQNSMLCLKRTSETFRPFTKFQYKSKNKHSWLLVCVQTILTEWPQLVDELSANFYGWRCVTWSAYWIPMPITMSFLDRSSHCFFQIAPQLSSRVWVDPFSDRLLLRKSGSTKNWTQYLWICSHELWSLDHRGGHHVPVQFKRCDRMCCKSSFCFRTPK
jgi:hypothetical protein